MIGGGQGSGRLAKISSPPGGHLADGFSKALSGLDLKTTLQHTADIRSIEPPDSHFLLAAHGWLELGNDLEAQQELERIDSTLRNHPEVIKVRWRLCAKTNNLNSAVEIARAIIQGHNCPILNRAEVLADSSAARPSEDALNPLDAGFPLFFAIPYNMACYACQAGNLTEAWDWFQIAVEMVTTDDARKLALRDPDLEPLWGKIIGL